MGYGNLKGLKIEIDGDTTKLTSALGKMDRKISATQRSLKAMDKALKFNPGNTDLLVRKQNALQRQLQETKNKSAQLKQAYDKLKASDPEGKHVNQLNALQREIDETKAKEAELTRELNRFGSVGAQKIAAVGGKLKTLGSNISGVGQAIMPVSVAAAGGLAFATKSAMSFEKSMAKVGTIADTSQVSMKTLSNGIMNLSNKTGKSTSDLSAGLYQAISASVKTKDAMKFMADAANLSKAGFLSTKDSVDVLTTVLNAYKMKASETKNVSDILIQTQNDGKTTVNELSKSLGSVIPTASALGVNLKNVASAYAIMTKGGISTAESGTYLRAMLNELGKEGSGVAQILKQKTGKTFGELMSSGKSLGDVLGILKDSVGGNSEKFKNLWANTRAGTGALALTKGGAKEFNDELQKMNGSAGNTSKALKTLGGSSSAQAKKGLNALKNIGTTLGTTLMATLGPTLEKVSNHLVKMANAFMKLSPTTQNIILVIGGIVATAGPLLMFIGSLMGSVGNILTMAPKIVGAIKNIGSAFSALGGFLAANPIVLIIAGIAALVVALVVLYHKSETFRNFVNGAVAAIKGVVLGVINGIKAGITGFVSAVSSAWNSLKSATTSAWNAVKNAILSVWNGIKSTVTGAVSAVRSTITGVWNGIKSTTSNVWNGIKNAVGNAINGAKGFINRFKPKLPHVNNPVASLLGWVKNAINKARSIINGFRPHLPKLSFPHINLPHFKVSGGSAPWGIGGKGSLPKFSVNWYKKGGIFDSPSIIGVGEAGPEAVLPISKLEGILKKTFKPQTVLNGTVFKIYAAEGQSAEAIGDTVLNKIIHLCKVQGGMISG